MVKIKSGQVTNAKQQIVSSSEGSIWSLTNKRNEMTVRFLDQADEWYWFMEHYMEGPGFFPCVADGESKESCPGCARDIKASRKYVANVISENKPILFKMPATLAERLVTRYERYGKEMRDRHYTLIRTGAGKNDTKYDVENGPESMGTDGLQKYGRKSKAEIDTIVIGEFSRAFPDWGQEEEPPF